MIRPQREPRHTLFLKIDGSNHSNNDEKYYIEKLGRTLNITVKPIPTYQKFKQLYTANSKDEYSHFAVVTDIDANESHPRDEVWKEVLKYNKYTKNSKVYVSNQQWEIWIIYHYTNNNPSIYTDLLKNPVLKGVGYNKIINDWYKKNIDDLINRIDTASENSERVRNQIFKNGITHMYPIECQSLSNFNSWLDQGSFTTVDLLIKKMKQDWVIK